MLPADAEGATSPESLRHQDRRGETPLESRCASTSPMGKARMGTSLRSKDSVGSQPRCHPPIGARPMRIPDDLSEAFASRHIGLSEDDENKMLAELGVATRADLIAQTVPPSIRLDGPLALPPALTEPEALALLRAKAARNEVFTSLIGLGYSATITPPVIARNVLENPAWYTAYTPYQPEISQGRLEALLNFQTMVSDLTAMDLANASLLDEATAAAEAMAMLHRVNGEPKEGKQADVFFV